jgi:hypothetical protein
MEAGITHSSRSMPSSIVPVDSLPFTFQCDIPPPLPPRSSAALLRLKTVKFDDELSDHESDSDSVNALAANHGLFTAHSKRSLAFSLDTPTDAEDESEPSHLAAVDSTDGAASGTLGILSPISGNPVACSPRCVSKRKNSNGLSARVRSITSDSDSKKQSPRRFSRNSNSIQPACERLEASDNSSFVSSPVGPPGAATTVAISAASSAHKTSSAGLADSSPQSSTSSSDNHRICVECGENWSFESKERDYFTAKGLHTPRRCGKCRSLKKLELIPLVMADRAKPSSVSGVLPTLGSSSAAEVAPQTTGSEEVQQHTIYRGTNLLGIGFVYEGGVNASGRQEGFGTQVIGSYPNTLHDCTDPFFHFQSSFEFKLIMLLQTWDTNHTYKGEWRGGRKEGRGIYTWPDGATYEGEYHQGRRHGSGLQTMNDGAV